MSERKYSPALVGIIGLIVVVTAVAILWRVVNGDSSLLRNVSVQKTLITPNADQNEDATTIAYELSRNAAVSIYFEDEAGQRYYFRQQKPRGAGEYRVTFSGVVDGYTLPGESIDGDVQTRLLPDGLYTWTVAATDDKGITEEVQGQLEIADADPVFPELRAFSIDKPIFTPNRDGISDRALIQFFLTKEVDQLRVFLQGPDGLEYPVEELELDVPARAEGWHYYDYEGGVDDGATPPPDGTYPVVVVAQDIEGQRIQVENELTIQYGGVPRARIFPPPNGDTLQMSATAVAICDTLYFTITVENYGTTPIRTTGPEPGTIYDSDWNYNTLGWHTESGAFRLAIGYENEISNYPYRWAVGGADDLQEIDGYTYLMPGERAVVTGGIRLTNVFGDRNPQPVWAGLIHEDVEISEFNNRVDSHSILVDIPDEAHISECPARDIPIKPV
ncbi:MAG: hypothetical protein KC415_06125, partial [Anaerolineales bacterium]|nr:hypothetical protein [Anaerolineales bacterium]